MTQHKTRKFIGRAVVVDPKTGEDSAYSAYVCVLLSGDAQVPSVTVCEAQTIDELLGRLKNDGLMARFSAAPYTFDPPPGDYPISHSMARQRYEALPYDEFNRAATIVSGR